MNTLRKPLAQPFNASQGGTPVGFEGGLPQAEINPPNAPGFLLPGNTPDARREAFLKRLLAQYNAGEIDPETYMLRKKRIEDMINAEQEALTNKRPTPGIPTPVAPSIPSTR